MQLRSKLAQFLEMNRGKFFNRSFSTRGQSQFHPAAIVGRRLALHESRARQAVDQTHRTVMPQLQAVSQFSD